MENLNWYNGKKVILTGHTGFKGAWMSLLLLKLGAEVHGISLSAESGSLYESLDGIDSELASSLVFDLTVENKELRAHISEIQPDCIIHMAAQSLVRRSYSNPIETFNTNVMGTARLLEVALETASIKWILVVTTDKVYMNVEKGLPFCEDEKLAGFDPYSASKVGAEMVANAFRVIASTKSAYRIGVARAGNVIGGGDRCEDRLIPDVVKNFSFGKDVELRNPDSIRPWQHVLDCITGYLVYGSYLARSSTYPNELNFGPLESTALTVKEVVQYISERWPNNPGYSTQSLTAELHLKPEANQLLVDSSLAWSSLHWKNQLDVEAALNLVLDWELDADTPISVKTRNQIEKYLLDLQ
jgi:CDP-glucose 4,6-dehydratase